MMFKKKSRIMAIITALLLIVSLTACDGPIGRHIEHELVDGTASLINEIFDGQDEQAAVDAPFAESLAEIPEYEGSPYVIINDNMPYFEAEDVTTEAFETFSELDGLGRCGAAYANVCQELMPTEERGDISDIKPSGWDNQDYGDLVDGGYLYNRCHLLGFQLTGENANERNLITGTRYMNTEGMLPFENIIADYVHETDNHVLYRVTPVYEGDDLVASGVLMEAYSVEDEGGSICFNVYCYNVQPGVEIDYATGENWLAR